MTATTATATAAAAASTAVDLSAYHYYAQLLYSSSQLAKNSFEPFCC